jgi:putative membrane protein
MTLLGALFATTPRALYSEAPRASVSAIADQHLGGGIMLLVGGASYLAGGLWLAVEGLRGVQPGAGAESRLKTGRVA